MNNNHGGKRKNSGRKKTTNYTHRISVEITQQMWERIVDSAYCNKQTLSDYIRTILSEAGL